jgi:hypothetical protein
VATMGRLRRVLRGSVLMVGLVAGCAHEGAYPPALPASPEGEGVPWGNTEFIPQTAPPPELAWPGSTPWPTEQEWTQLRAYVPPQKVCRGKGKKRHCTLVRPTAVDRANVTALVKPSAVHMRGGQSVLVRYPLSLPGVGLYQIVTSPSEFTNVLLPAGEVPAAELTLSPKDWQVLYNEPAAPAAVQLIKVKPRTAGQKGRDMLLTASGYPLYLEFISTERPGMLSVTWDLPTRLAPTKPEAPPLDQRPPKFHNALAYNGYTWQVQGKSKVSPPWLPKSVVDDGTNTVVKFGASLEGQRLPAVSGLNQKGKAVIVASRLYVYQGKEASASWWLYIQGLHPAFELTDTAGMKVRVVRDAPAEETRHAGR